MRQPIFAIIAALACWNGARAHAELPCRIELQATLPLSYVSNLAVVETKINGVRALLGVDTGAKTILTPEAVKSLGLPRDWRRTRAVGTTAILISPNYIVKDLEFAGRRYEYESLPAFALRQDGTAIKGLLGTDILADFDLDFDFPNKKLSVYKVSGCRSLTPPGFTPAASMRFSHNFQRGAVLDAELDGKKLAALIDTGATKLFITRAAASRLKVTAATVNTDLTFSGTGIGNVSVKQAQHQFQSLKIGGETVREPLIGIITTPVTTGDILLGQSFLFSRRFYISNATRTLYLEKPPAPLFSYAPSHVVRQHGATTGNNSEEKVLPVAPPVISEPPAIIRGGSESSSQNSEPAAPPARSYTPSQVVRQAGANSGNNSGAESLPLSKPSDGSGKEDGAQDSEPIASPAFSYTPSIAVRRPAGGNAP